MGGRQWSKPSRWGVSRIIGGQYVFEGEPDVMGAHQDHNMFQDPVLLQVLRLAAFQGMYDASVV